MCCDTPEVDLLNKNISYRLSKPDGSGLLVHGKQTACQARCKTLQPIEGPLDLANLLSWQCLINICSLISSTRTVCHHQAA